MKFFRSIGLGVLLLSSCFSIQLKAQDTLKLMTYNLLRYGCQGISCTPTPVTTRNPWFRAVIQATLPDILGVNEIGPYESAAAPAENLLLNVLQYVNPDYARANVTFNSYQDVANCLFYRPSKLGLKKQAVIYHSTRDINYYQLYHRNAGLATGDTTWLEVVQVHLHSSDPFIRGQQATAIMDFLDSLGHPGNFIVMGDFNLQSSTEPAFQTMVSNANPDIKMNDPLNLLGNWHQNNAINYAWSQSPRTSNLNDCGIGTTLDDRYDVIVLSNDIMTGNSEIEFVPGSYRVVGNPFAPNPAVTPTLLNYLKYMADHLPVMLKLAVPTTVSIQQNEMPEISFRILNNPCSDFLEMEMNVPASLCGNYSFSLFDLQGKKVKDWELELNAGMNRTALSLEGISGGLFFVEMRRDEEFAIREKILINR